MQNFNFEFDLTKLTGPNLIIAIGALAFLLIVHIIVSSIMGRVTFDKGYSRAKGFHLTFWLGIIGMIIVAATPDVNAQRNQEEIIELLRELKKREDRHQDVPTQLQRFVPNTDSADAGKLPEI